MMEDETQVEETLEETVQESPEDIIQKETIPEGDPVEEIPDETPAENPQTVTVLPDNEVTVNEIPEEDFEALLSAGEEDLTGYRTISLTQLDLPEGEQSGVVPSVMVEVVESVLGEYQRRTYTVEEYDTDGNLIGTSTEYVPGLAGLDYAWITGAILFAMFIGGIFKLLGGLIRS